jgi:signal transduction histidine kinase
MGDGRTSKADVKLRSVSTLAWSLWAAAAALGAAELVFSVLNRDTNIDGNAGPFLDALFALVTMVLVTVGALVASRRPQNPLGWIFVVAGVLWSLVGFAEGYGLYSLYTDPGALPGGEVMAWVTQWAFIPSLFGTPALLFLLFPDGHPPSGRWRPVVWLVGLTTGAAALDAAVSPGGFDAPFKSVVNPFAVEGGAALPVLATFGWAGMVASVLVAAVSMVVRLRRSRGLERQQLKWVASAAALFALACLVGVSSYYAGQDTFGSLIIVLAFMTIPIVSGYAIMRHRLYDVDLVINRAVMFGALAVFITAVYVGIVVGVSALLGRAGNPNIALSILGTAIVAVAFQPARVRAQHLANRLVYGKRATPYEVLAEFSEQAATTVATEEVLPKIARTIGEGTGAERSEVWVRSGSELRLAASWPSSAPHAPRRVTLDDGHLPDSLSAHGAVPVRHQSELLGALTVVKPRGETLTDAEQKLLADLASQAGLVLRNVGLTAELLARLDELTASRQRLVSAQDEERRRLERNLHDGAQQHLVALKVKLNLAARQAEDPQLKEALVSLQADTDEAVEALRELARGIYPPLLAEQGLASALEGQTRKSAVPVRIEAAGDFGRYPQDVEAAVYFCCLEALQNVAKYADPSTVVVRLFEEDGKLCFTVRDDGAGFDVESTPRGSGTQNMSDRLEVFDGRLEVASSPGAGTTVRGELPLQ